MSVSSNETVCAMLLNQQVWAVVGSHGKNPIAEKLAEVPSAAARLGRTPHMHHMQCFKQAHAHSHLICEKKRRSALFDRDFIRPQKLERAGKTVYRVNPKGQPPALRSLSEIDQKVECVNLVINAALGAAVVEECAALPARRR
jgi:hypothetical protein